MSSKREIQKLTNNIKRIHSALIELEILRETNKCINAENRKMRALISRKGLEEELFMLTVNDKPSTRKK